MHTDLANILHQTGLLDSEQYQQVLECVQNEGDSVSSAVRQLGVITPAQLVDEISLIFGLPTAGLDDHDYASLCQQLKLRDLVLRHQALPLHQDGHTLYLAVSDPSRPEIEEEFAFACNCVVILLLADEADIRARIRQLYGESRSGMRDAGPEISLTELSEFSEQTEPSPSGYEDIARDQSPVSRFVHQVLLEAVRKGASDIHFEPFEHEYRIRLRCDGLLHTAQSPPAQLNLRLAARLKIIANLDIAERRLPQDGRIKLHLSDDQAVDIRVSTLPTQWGEKIVLRLLDSGNNPLNIETLGMAPEAETAYRRALSRPQGMILVTGPTGSGKTLTLYSGLHKLNTPERNISTAEDPIEINLPGICQVQVENKIGLNFSSALRAFLRQDPDVVMVGEIRDLETAEIAVKAAQTGHLVMSTLHTNSAAETLSRLSNMGIETYNLAASLSLIIAQRLVRRLCPHCKTPDDNQYPELGGLSEPIWQHNPKGCNECTGGFKGRTGVFEVMPVDTELKNALSDPGRSVPLAVLAQQATLQTLKQSGLEKVREGVTSYTELQRVLYL